MKTRWLFVASLFLILQTGSAQVSSQITNQASIPPPTRYKVVSRDGNSAIWQRTTYELGASGEVVSRTHKYTELATGLNYLRNGKWIPSTAEIDILPNGTAAATNGQHKAYFPGDIANGVINLVTPDGKNLQSRPICLCYDDGNHTVVIAMLTNSIGEVAGRNEVLYPNAFQGASASMVYHYTRAGFEQDVLVQGRLPSPAAFGLDPGTTRLQMLTEFFDTNNPVGMERGADVLSRPTLSFGKMKISRGRAFSINNTNYFNSRTGGTPTIKSWMKINGRKFLLEEVPYQDISQQLEQLPMTGSVNRINTNMDASSLILDKLSSHLLLPDIPI